MTISEILKEESSKNNLADKICYLHGTLVPNDIKPDIKEFATSLTKRIIESEIERLRPELQKGKHEDYYCYICSDISDECIWSIYDKALQDIISHLESELKLIEHDT